MPKLEDKPKTTSNVDNTTILHGIKKIKINLILLLTTLDILG